MHKKTEQVIIKC